MRDETQGLACKRGYFLNPIVSSKRFKNYKLRKGCEKLAIKKFE